MRTWTDILVKLVTSVSLISVEVFVVWLSHEMLENYHRTLQIQETHDIYKCITFPAVHDCEDGCDTGDPSQPHEGDVGPLAAHTVKHRNTHKGWVLDDGQQEEVEVEVAPDCARVHRHAVVTHAHDRPEHGAWSIRSLLSCLN